MLYERQTLSMWMKYIYLVEFLPFDLNVRKIITLYFDKKQTKLYPFQTSTTFKRNSCYVMTVFKVYMFRRLWILRIIVIALFSTCVFMKKINEEQIKAWIRIQINQFKILYNINVRNDTLNNVNTIYSTNHRHFSM